jgi:hypothetical protein
VNSTHRRHLRPFTHSRATLAALLAAALLGAACGSENTLPGAMPSPTPVPSPTPTPVVSPAGLVLLLHMEEAAWDGRRDQVIDSSGQGNHGTATSGATTVAEGRFGRGGSFSGGGSCVEIGDVPALRPTTQLTLSAWVFPTGLDRQTARGIIAKRIDFQFKSAYAFFVYTDNRLFADVNNEDDRFAAGPELTNGRWYHVALVYDGSAPTASRVTVYVDGTAVGSGVENAATITAFESPLWVGCLPLTSPAQGFAGTLDEVAVWHRALSPAEIQILARATGPIQTLIGDSRP